MTAVCKVTEDSSPDIASYAFKALINLTADAGISKQIVDLAVFPRFGQFLIGYVLNRDSLRADNVCQLLSNLTRETECAHAVLMLIIEHTDEMGMEKMVHALCMVNYNKCKQQLHYLATLLCNLTQIATARKFILDKSKCVVQRLLPFTTYKQSLIRRGGVVGILHNCCFETG